MDLGEGLPAQEKLHMTRRPFPDHPAGRGAAGPPTVMLGLDGYPPKCPGTEQFPPYTTLHGDVFSVSIKAFT